MEDDKLAIEEARRAGQHEAVKSQVEGEVQSEISQRAAAKPPPGEAQKIDQVAGDFRARAVDEVVDTEHEVQRARGLARVSQIVDYIFYVIYAVLAMRFLLALLAARSAPALYGSSLPLAIRFMRRSVGLCRVRERTADTR